MLNLRAEKRVQDLFVKGTAKELRIEGVVFKTPAKEADHVSAITVNGELVVLKLRKDNHIILSRRYAKGSNPEGGYVGIENNVLVSARTRHTNNIPCHDGYDKKEASRRILLDGGRFEVLVF